MKKKIVGLIAIVSALVFCFALSGCGGGGNKGEDNAKNFIGTWEISAMESDDEATGEEDLALLKEMGINIVLDLKADGMASLTFTDEDPQTGTWEAKSATACKITLDGEAIEATLDNGALNMVDGGDKFTFKKASSADKSQAAPSSEDKKSPTSGAPSAKNTIVDDALCTITVTGTGEDAFGDPCYKVTLENNDAAKVLYFSYVYDTFTVNGKMVDPIFSVVVQPGAYAEDVISFDVEEVGGGVDTLKNVKGILEVRDNDSFDVLREYDFSM